jgi:nitroreductase
MLAAWAHGVGSCIASIFPADNVARAKTLLGIPAGLVFHTAIAFGYPADAAATRLSSGAPPEVLAEVRPGRKDEVAFVSWERYGQRRPTADGSS